MTAEKPQAIHRRDYRPYPYQVEAIDLDFDLMPERTLVRARTTYRLRDKTPPQELVLDGENLDLLSIAIDDVPLGPDRYRQSDDRLVLQRPPARFQLTIETRIAPSANTALEGLYVSNDVFCTQCEAEGFRRITFFPDRPDVLAVYRTTLRADKAACPVLLSNGNLTGRRDLADGRHEAVWHDPFPKPSYLFAVVAGDLACNADRFVTGSGRAVDLRIYCPHGLEGRTQYAMDALKRAMAWDEARYGLEYDLDIFNIVAINDFNMGAMENKSLNIFNAKYIMADPETATDDDYAFIESVVAHEYFHNWTGNRVTCRDWFQLSLKEGLTVYRDQCFSADMRSAGVQRIRDVRSLRQRQFPEDSGPLAHPVRPDSYIEINNFYTATVYDKGAEVIRMIETLLGREGFRKGMDLYFQRHDGQAVTCDDFVAAMADANQADLDQFALWYRQAGTPEVTIEETHDPDRREVTIRARQSCPPTPGQPEKAPMQIPLRIGIVDSDIDELWVLTERTQSRSLPASSRTPVLSVNRGFSAPIIVRRTTDADALATSMTGDSDPFARWEAAQDFAVRVILAMVDAIRGGQDPVPDEDHVAAWGRVLDDQDGDPGFLAECLALPSMDYLAQQMSEIDFEAIYQARETVRRALADTYDEKLTGRFHRLAINEPHRPDWRQAGRRAMRNLLLWVIAARPEHESLVAGHFHDADNMTDRMAALGILVHRQGTARDRALAGFYDRYRDDKLVLDKWFSVQAMAQSPDTLARVQALMDHPAFTMTNPNKVRALIGAFASGNPLQFHWADGSGYRFLASQVLALDPLNPQTAARLMSPFGRWRRFDSDRKALMKTEIERVLAAGDLSRDVFEIASKMLAEPEAGPDRQGAG